MKYHARVMGEGQPLIFLPAGGFSGVEGLNIAESLSDHYECHLLDLPGMGKSDGIKGKVTLRKMADWLKGYIDQNQFEKVTLVGHSMGGGIGLCFATVYPNKINKIVLLDQGHKRIPRFPVGDLGVMGYITPLISGLEALFGDRFVKILARFWVSDASDEEKEKQLKYFCEKVGLKENDYIRKAFAEDVKFTPEGLRLMIGYYRLNLPRLLAQLTVPTLLIYATFTNHDQKESQRTAKAIEKLKRNLTSDSPLMLHGMNSHHYLHWADLDCLEIIKKFLLDSESLVI